MPPKKRAPPRQRVPANQVGPQPLYKSAMGYYKAAYRIRLKQIRPAWTNAQIVDTLAWLWRHVSDAERLIFTNAYTTAAQALPPVDDSTIPANPRGKNDAGPGVAAVAAAPVPAPIPAPAAAPAPAPAPARINTTRMAYWPDIATMDAELPNLTEVHIEDRDKSSAEKRNWLAAGLHNPDLEPDAKRWHGAHFLGHGSNGRAGLWVRVDDAQNIDDMIAARDVATMPPSRWTDPIMWRDQLPREIAIQVRLNEQNGYEHNIHRYLGHRINFRLRRYRVFNEVCGLGDLYHALSPYPQPWVRRRNMFRWLEAHPEIGEAREAYEADLDIGDDGETAGVELNNAIEDAWNEYTRERDQRANDAIYGIQRVATGSEIYQERTHAEFDNMPGIATWNGQRLPEELPEVIDEGFLWHVFDSLATALLVLKNGNNVEVQGKEWKEIVHKDLYLSNVFVKPPENSDGKVLNALSSDEDCLIEYTQDEWPRIVLADWDQAFFDLQSADDEYADNPLHYALGYSPNNIDSGGARYPPELYWDYAGHASAFSKLTSKTDVWGLGQVLWNLIMQNSHHQSPFPDAHGPRAAPLVNGFPYDAPTAATLLTGTSPFEAARQYSEELKDLVRMCLRYGMEERPTVEEVKARTAEGVERWRARKTGSVRVGVSQDLRDFRIGELFPSRRKGRGGGGGEEEEGDGGYGEWFMQ